MPHLCGGDIVGAMALRIAQVKKIQKLFVLAHKCVLKMQKKIQSPQLVHNLNDFIANFSRIFLKVSGVRPIICFLICNHEKWHFFGSKFQNAQIPLSMKP